jgi:hypothetical protein
LLATTSIADLPYIAWFVDFGVGGFSDGGKDFDDVYIRAVRH